jgi:hypothetical protein
MCVSFFAPVQQCNSAARCIRAHVHLAAIKMRGDVMGILFAMHESQDRYHALQDAYASD